MELINFNNLSETLNEYAAKVRDAYKENLTNNNRIASGKLIDTIEYKVDFDGNAYVVTLKLQDYWKYIEYGTKPHFPPVNKILEWVQIKPVIPRPDANGRIPTPKQLAFLIARKISQVGTQGSDDLDTAIQLINQEFKDKMVFALHKDMEVLMKVLIGGIQGSVPGR